MCGDIHLYDVMYNRETPIVMPGSMIMQDFGEKVKGHGYILWDVETRSHKQIDIPSDYGFYTFKIKSFEDIENESEKLVNV
jgi:DNA repair exonuclease SbcCD nuclease subunit